MPEAIQFLQQTGTVTGAVQTTSNTNTQNKVRRRPRSHNVISRPISLDRVSEWFWPGFGFNYEPTDTHYLITYATTTPDVEYFPPYYIACGPSSTTEETPNEPPSSEPENPTECEKQSCANTRELASIPCKSCRHAGRDCDRQQPRCSQCRHEQILCFYVSPLFKKNRKEKKAKEKEAKEKEAKEKEAKEDMEKKRAAKGNKFLRLL